MVRVLVITICIVLDVWLLHQIWVEERHLRSKSEKLIWTIGILFTHAIAAAVYIFLDTTKNNDNENSENNNL